MPIVAPLDRRRLFQTAGSFAALGALSACTVRPMATPVFPAAPRPVLPPLRARADRLFDITVCLRPFRGQGPRIEAEHIGRTLVVHNYGHGCSGGSLSWGSGTAALQIAMEHSPREVAVVGCGALGLTSAILAQEAGCKVTIYAKDLLADARSARATGSFTPDSRIGLKDHVAPDFGDKWEAMARLSFKRYRRYLGLPGNPVEWIDRYFFADAPTVPPPVTPQPPLAFAEFRERIRDIAPFAVDLPAEKSPFPGHSVRWRSDLIFNIADYGHTLMSDFLAAGGKFVHREFHDLSELAGLPQKVVINCPGYGARALCKDESVVPVRGQIGWLIPQPELNYGVFYKDVMTIPRRDGIVVQALGGGDMRGYGDDHEVVDRAESVQAVETLAELFPG